MPVQGARGSESNGKSQGGPAGEQLPLSKETRSFSDLCPSRKQSEKVKGILESGNSIGYKAQSVKRHYVSGPGGPMRQGWRGWQG